MPCARRTHRSSGGTSSPPPTEPVSHRLAPGRWCHSVPTRQRSKRRFREKQKVLVIPFHEENGSETGRESPKVTAVVDRRAKADLAT